MSSINMRQRETQKYPITLICTCFENTSYFALHLYIYIYIYISNSCNTNFIAFYREAFIISKVIAFFPFFINELVSIAK